MPELRTPRLRLVPATLELLDAECDEPGRLASLLGVTDIAEWPPAGSDYDRDVIDVFRSQLVADPTNEGWNTYYVCTDDALVGNGGYFGPPTDGVTEIGYAVCLAWRTRGIATEVVRALIERASAMGLFALVAHTRPDNEASIKVLVRNGFRQDASASPDHLRFVRPLRD